MAEGISKYVKNILWLFSDRIVRMILGVFVSVWVARYLEPTLFGKWNYAVAYVGIFTSIANLGIDTIVVRTLVRYPAKGDIVLGSGFILLVVANIATFFVCILSAGITEGFLTESFYTVVITSLSLLFNSYLIVDYWIQATLRSKYTFWAQNIAYAVSTSFKLILLTMHARFEYFIWISVVDTTALFITYFVIYKQKFGVFSEWKFSSRMVSVIFKNSWVFIITNLAIIIYMRIDQLMIGKILGDSEVGIYSTAVKIAELWYFVPMTVATAVFPLIIEIRQRNRERYLESVQLLYSALSWLAIAFGLFCTIFSKQIVVLIFGPEYIAAATPLSISVWAGVLVSQGVARGKWLVAENLQRYSIWYTVWGAIVNVLLNLMLIPTYGIVGACVATLFGMATAVIIAPFFLKKTRISAIMIVKSINPVPLINFLIKLKKSRQAV